ncbi:MAG: protein kinase domain-containing protein [Nannocystaceae bacterium]|nr:serine/threonine-protein kinase [bacterium]
MDSDDLYCASTEDAESFDEALRQIAAAPPIDPPNLGAELQPGTLVAGTFRVERKLGEGGMGVVYRVHDLELDRPVALKLQSKESEQSTIRMAREARAMARLSHPNVVPVHEVGQHEGQVFIAMEYIPGGTVRQWLEESPRSWQEIVQLFIQAGRGLAAAHAIELVHRDFKPDNVLVGEDGRALVADFGLARAIVPKPEGKSVERTAGSSQAAGQPATASPESRTSSSVAASDLSNKITKTGAMVGTMAYMAPEQWAGSEIDARTDQFSFCVALFEALCGVRPFAGRSAGPLLYNIQRGEIRAPLPGRRVPRRILKILRRGLAADPYDRFASMDVLLRRLERPPMSRGRVAFSLGALLIAGVAGAAATAATDDDDPCRAGAAQMRSLWTPEVKDELTQAAAATGKPHVGDTVQRALAPLASYADAWAEAYTEACTATHVRKEQTEGTFELIAACLADRRQAYEAVVQELRSGDVAALESSVRAAGSLPTLDPCTNADALRKLDPLPTDPDVRRSLLELRAEIQAVPDELSDLDYEDALARAHDLLERAQAIGYRPTIGRARLRIVQLQQRADGLSSDELVREAFNDGLASGDYHLAAEAAAHSVEFYASKDATEAHRWGATGQTLLEEIGASKLESLDLMRAEGVAYGMAGDFTKAEPIFREIIDVRTARDPEDPSLINAYSDLAVTLYRKGEVEASASMFEEAYARTIQAEGERHPNASRMLANLARITLALGKKHEALTMFEEARGQLAAAYGEEHAEVARIDNHLAELYAATGEVERAIVVLERGIAIMRTTGGQRLTARFDAEVLYSQLLSEVGRDAEAQASLKATIEALREHALPSGLAAALTEAASQAHRRGEHRDALKLGREAIEILGQTELANGRSTAWVTIGEAHFALEELSEAESAFRSAVQAAEGIPLATPYAAKAVLGIAKVQEEQGSIEPETEGMVRGAVESLEGVSGASHVTVDALRGWLERQGYDGE